MLNFTTFKRTFLHRKSILSAIAHIGVSLRRDQFTASMNRREKDVYHR